MIVQSSFINGYKALVGTLNMQIGMWIAMLALFWGSELSPDFHELFIWLNIMHPVLAIVLLVDAFISDRTFKFSTIGTIIGMMVQVYVILIIAEVLLNPDFKYED